MHHLFPFLALLIVLSFVFIVDGVKSKNESSAAVWFGKKFGHLMLECMDGGIKGKSKQPLRKSTSCASAWNQANFTGEEKRLFNETISNVDKFASKNKFYEALWEKSKIEQFGWAFSLMETLKHIEAAKNATEWKSNGKLSAPVKVLMKQLENSIDQCKKMNENGLPNSLSFVRLFNVLYNIDSQAKHWNETDKEVLKNLLDWQNLILQFLSRLVNSH